MQTDATLKALQRGYAELQAQVNRITDVGSHCTAAAPIQGVETDQSPALLRAPFAYLPHCVLLESRGLPGNQDPCSLEAMAGNGEFKEPCLVAHAPSKIPHLSVDPHQGNENAPTILPTPEDLAPSKASGVIHGI
jgi:hypothetical protein